MSIDFPTIELPASANDCESIVRFLLAELVRNGKLQSAQLEILVQDFLHRESLGSTAVGRGVAIPHIKSKVAKRTVGIIGRSKQPVAWDGTLKGSAVNAVCLVVISDAEQTDWLQVIESVAQSLFPTDEQHP
jgi:mannitol/fructose-specific phosphotransferase system IIA component (Ntr-type)